MIRRNIPGLLVVAALSCCLLPGSSVAQQKTLREQLIGIWSLVSFDSTGADGKKTAVFGAQPKGILMIDAGGRYAMVLTDQGRPKWKSNLRTELTTEEFANAAKGLVAQFGAWSVDEGSKMLTRKVEGALSPNLAGTEQKVTVGLSGDELTVTDSNSGVTGGRTETIYRRAK
jgi:hypothetical protein